MDSAFPQHFFGVCPHMVDWLRLAAEKDFTPNGLTRDSLEQIRTAAERGDVASQTYLAGCYARGILVPLDYDEALKWFRRAAILGDEKAKEAARRLEKMCEAPNSLGG